MFSRQIASVMALGLFGTCLFAQGLQTKATKDDWEEINFEFNSAILSDGYPTLLRIAELLQQHRDYKIKVEGHTDYVGSVPYNEKLALARGNEVKAFLTKYGAGAGQISVSGQGKRVPEVPNTTKEGRFINRRVVLTVTDGNGNIIAAGSGPEVVNTLDDRLKRLEDCCNQILKKLDKLDDILAAIRDLKAENDRLKSDVAALKNRPEPQIPQPPPPPPPPPVVAAKPETRKYTTVAANVGPTTYGGLTFTGTGRFFAPFGETHAVQAQGEYMYHGGGASRVEGRQEGQFDLGLVSRFDNLQVGLFSSFKYLNLAMYQTGGALGQGALTFDYIFKRGRIGAFGTKGFMNTADLNHATLGPASYTETYAQIVDQVGGSALLGLWGDAYAEGNIGYLRLHGGTASNGLGTGKPGGMIRLVQPLSAHVAATLEAGLNETLVTNNNSGRVVFGLQFGNWLRPKEYGDVRHPVPVDVPRVRYQLLTRQVGHSPPVADAGPSQIGVPAGTITLNGSASYSPDGLALTYQWTQVYGPNVAITGANTAIATFTAAASQSYGFRLTVKDPYGLTSSATTTVTTVRTATIQILEFSASPDTIASGASSQLSWNVRGATTVSISPTVGTVLPQGVKTVTPTATTTYTLTASAPGLPTQTATATVTVSGGTGNPLILRFEAIPTNIISGESSMLSWTTQGAATVTISGVSGNLALSGSTSVSPTQTTTYTLTATSTDGRSVTASVVVTVSNGQLARIVSFTANPVTIDVGGSSQLCWVVENATTVSVAPGPGTVAASACVTVTPTTTTTYTLTAVNGQGSVTASTTVNVGGTIKVISFTSSPEFSTMAGSPVVLSWSTSGATSVNITGNITGSGSGSNLPPNGTLTVNPNTNTDYTLTAYGPGGAVVSVTIQVFVR
jgi:OmpA family/PKD domain